MKIKPVKKWLFLILMSIIISLPVFFYTHQFPGELLSDHQRWAEFGSYIGGIYSPIMAFLMLLVLFRQLILQEDFNEYQKIQTQIQRSENDIAYYIQELNECLSLPKNSEPKLRSKIESDFVSLADDILMSEDIKRAASFIYLHYPKILDYWAAIYASLTWLEEMDETFCRLAFSNQKLKLQSILTVGVCISLDKLYYCQSKNAMNDNYYFKDKLKQ